jgi:hypothetical protein
MANVLPVLRALLLVSGLGLGLALRVAGVGEGALFGDEYHTVVTSRAELGTILTTFDTVGSHVVLPLLQHVSVALFGESVTSLRLPALLPGLLTLLLLYPVARRFVGPTPALVATLALAVSPMHVYYSRFGRSYALIVLLALVVVAALERATSDESGERARRSAWAVVFLASMLLPYTHLSTAGLVAAFAVVALLCARRGGPRALLLPLGVFAAAAAGCFLLFTPILGQVSDYFAQTAEVKDQPETWFGIPLLLAGGPVAGVLWLVGGPVGFVLLARERRKAALVLCATLVGPLVVLLVTRPHGMEFAWARYLLAAVPFVPVVLAWLLHRAARRFTGSELRADLATLVLGGVAVGTSLVTGPLLAQRPTAGTFDNTYLAMRALPAFDDPWPQASPIYAELAAEGADLRVVEALPMLTRSVLLLRNHALAHGHEVVVGWPEGLPESLAGGPYVDLATLDLRANDVVVLHKNLKKEVRAYWRHVYGPAWAERENALDAGFMQRHTSTFVAGQPFTGEDVAALWASRLRERFGPAVYKDDQVVVWRPATGR